MRQGSLDFGDLDGDGDLDLIVAGLGPSGSPRSRVYRLEDSLYVQSIAGAVVQLPFKVYRPSPQVVHDVWQGSTRWGDFDTDGDDDLLVFGLSLVEREVGTPVLEVVGDLYESRDGVLVRVETGLPGLHSSDADWGDFDGDGDLDLAVCGATALEPPHRPVTQVYENLGGRLSLLDSRLPGAILCSLAWGDLDGDGALELALSGESDVGAFTSVFSRDPQGAFVDLAVPLPPLYLASMDWSHADQTGRQRLLIAGGILDPAILRGQTFLVTAAGTGSVSVTSPVPGVVSGVAAWVDHDVDGRQDALVVGAETVLGRRLGGIYLSREGGSFQHEFTLAGLTLGDAAVGDYNGDGDEDLILTGETDSGAIQVLFLMNRTFPEFIPEGFIRR